MTRRPALVFLVALCALLGLGVALPAAHAEALRPAAGAALAQAGAAQGTRVAVVGVSGLRWDAVRDGRLPALARLLADGGAAGALSVRDADARTTTADGWATLAAGNRGSADPADERRLHRDFGTDPQALGAALDRAGVCASVLGPLATRAAAGSREEQLATPGWGDCPVTLVEAGPDAADAVVDALAATRRPGDTLLVVGTGGDTQPHLQVAALADGGDPGDGRLRSASTRRAPYVQLVDVAPTVLDRLGLARPSSMSGQPILRAGGATSPAALADADRAARAVGTAYPRVFVGVAALLVLLAGLAWARRPVRTLGLVLGAVPAATFLAQLVPWWRAGASTLAAAGLTAAFAVAGGLAAAAATRRAGPWAGAGLVAAGTAVVLAADLLTGGHLQMDSLLGYSPLVAGRFAGVGNLAAGALGTAALLCAGWLAQQALSGCAPPGAGRRAAVTAVVLVGLATVLVDGAPPWGSDLGGVLALVPAFAVVGVTAAGRRVTVRAVLAAAVGAVALVALLAAADYSRPADAQTHLGRFLGQLLHGGAGTVLARKARADAALATGPVQLLIIVPVLLALLVVVRPGPRVRAAYARTPLLRATWGAVLLFSVIGLLVNDSGVAIVATAVLVGLPLGFAVVPAQPTRDGPTRDGPTRDGPLGNGPPASPGPGPSEDAAPTRRVPSRPDAAPVLGSTPVDERGQQAR